MKRKFQEWWSQSRAKNPGKTVLAVILLFNVLFFLLSAAVISALSLDGTEGMDFIHAAFITITMVLDAGCIQFVLADIGHAGIVISLTCIIVVVVGMISFTGAVIGYVTNTISNFIENAKSGKHKVYISNHVVILNWNSRASEIINDFLYSEKKQKVVVLVTSRKEEVEKEIEERLSDTITRENRKIYQEYQNLPKLIRFFKTWKSRFRRNVTVLVREGDVFSSKQLQEISLERARSIIILGNDINNTICKFEHKDRLEQNSRGNSHTVKTLMQVADITSAKTTNNNQRIIVEITDNWTWDLVQKIIKSKEKDGKCVIVPVRVNQVLGQILSQFSLMPELNMTYEELFSNKGCEFYTVEQEKEDTTEFAKRYLAEHKHAIPLTFMEERGKTYAYYVADDDTCLERKSVVEPLDGYKVKMNRNYWIERKNVVILGHNSKSVDIMQGFESFCGEWDKDGEHRARLVVIDDKQNLEKMNYYKDYPFVIKTVAADIYDEELICSTIEEFVDSNAEDTSILILSDDSVLNEDIDANALANLVYVRQIIEKRMENPDFDPYSIDVIVEIINPKHHDIVNSYSVNNVVISNRYISKMIAQIGEVDALFNFYKDILSYDDDGDEDGKEIYIKKVSRLFDELPAPTTADKFIRAMLEASTDESLPPEKRDPNFALGYVKPDGKMILFGGDQSQIPVHLEKNDKLIVFCSH